MININICLIYTAPFPRGISVVKCVVFSCSSAWLHTQVHNGSDTLILHRRIRVLTIYEHNKKRGIMRYMICTVWCSFFCRAHAPDKSYRETPLRVICHYANVNILHEKLMTRIKCKRFWEEAATRKHFLKESLERHAWTHVRCDRTHLYMVETVTSVIVRAQAVKRNVRS